MTVVLAKALAWLLGIGILTLLAGIGHLTAPIYLIALLILVAISALGMGGANQDNLRSSEFDFRTTCPERMKLGDWSRVVVRGGGPWATDLSGGSQLVRVSIRASADEFKVKDLSSSDQIVSMVETSAWDFDLKPLRTGKRTIRILKTLLDANSRVSVRDFEPDDYTLVVQFNVLYWLEEFVRKEWKYLISGAGLALVALGWKAKIFEYLSAS